MTAHVETQIARDVIILLAMCMITVALFLMMVTSLLFGVV